MDDMKRSLLPQVRPDNESKIIEMRRRTPKRFSFHVTLFMIVFGLFWLSSRQWQCTDPSHHHHNGEGVGEKVPLEIHIMSKCPDARNCLQQLVVPAMANVSDKVDFRLSFIGETTQDDDGVQCKHGQTECLGNIVELCAASEYPDPKIYLGFTMCLSQDYQNIPKEDLLKECSLEHGIDFEKLNHCVSKEDGAYAMGMLRKSVERSAELGVVTSCTIRLNGQERCVYDNGKSRDCEGGSRPEDLIHDINKLYEAARGWTE
ncbi:hypothetical protein P154DRAFT_58797 [Amniculicola lignicola CBS 123094]|uniref:Gamma interferon inducible lysosomal thiol reductase n=1 Tax=Amniculicola lignicola CBS 123094 TaxID=1392246 RepID=A0A6A5W3I4_9PLEO|nr:hypothetical protein P154DRAFT_58797 [Amniculicola lignicola CBS 123094]